MIRRCQDLHHFKKWTRVIESMGDVKVNTSKLPQISRLQMAHEAAKPYRYIPEGLDYWKTPQEFVGDGGGDCEDYAIFRYFHLIQNAFPEENLDICLGMHRPRLLHAALRARTNDGQEFYLCNMQNAIVKAEEYLKHFSPIYYINRIGWILP